MSENQNVEYKSLRFLKPNSTNWDELAKDCVCLANARGGHIYIGIEDKASLPPPNQIINDKTIINEIQKRIAERTINVAVIVIVQIAANKAEFIDIEVVRNVQTIASTTDGRYYVRVSDVCRPVPPDEMARLAAEKNAFVWEDQTTKKCLQRRLTLRKNKHFLTI